MARHADASRNALLRPPGRNRRRTPELVRAVLAGFGAVRWGSCRQVSSPGRPGDTPEERNDRNLADLQQELRVATLGLQVLFGFLLGLPFTSHFSALHAWQRGQPAIVQAVLTAGMFGGLWFALPAAWQRSRNRSQPLSPSRPAARQRRHRCRAARMH